MSFDTTGASFSPNHIDRGTLAMLAALSRKDALGAKLLDLGCGYGVVGIYAAKLIGEHNVYMSDVDPTCVELAKRNALLNGVGGATVILSDGFRDIHEKDFTLILANPPYQADFAIPKHFIEKGFNRLTIGGAMMMVTKRKLWYKNKFIAIFGGVGITEVDGYNVFYAEKRNSQYANAKINRKQK